MMSNFLLGELKLTEPARLKLKRIPFDLICRHAINEHGDISPDEAKQNHESMHTMGPLISRYRADPTDPKSPTVVIYTRQTWDETVVYID
jgi:hypothetical protein